MGIFISLFNRTLIFESIFNNNINPLFQINGNTDSVIIQFQSWIYGVLGATISGWGILLAFQIYYPFTARQQWSWSSIAVSICMWYVLDTSISFYFNVYFNAVFNTVLLLAFIIPLYFTKKYFR